MQLDLAVPPAPSRHLCPVPGCPAADPTTHHGWRGFAGLRAHIDSHLLGSLPGPPPPAWMLAGRWTTCPCCGKLLSSTVALGMHKKCWANHIASHSSTASPFAAALPQHAGPDPDLDGHLPSLQQISEAPIPTIEFVSSAALHLVDLEYRRCLANVVLFNRPDAWQPGTEGPDETSRKRARVAWTELHMFPKACLAQQPGGLSKRKRNAAVLQTRLEQWRAGEREALWAAAPRYTHRHPPDADSVSDDQAQRILARQQRVVVHLASQGLPAKAVNRLTSLGLAPDTPAIERLLRSKFPPPPPHQAVFVLPAAPPANELTDENLLRSIRSFQRGAGPGPSGLRPDLLKQLLDLPTSVDTLPIMVAFANLLANGEAPLDVAPTFAGACGYAFRKATKTGAPPGAPDDARPVCAGEAWRRAIGKALLRTEADRLAEHLAPHQMAVLVSGGAEVLPHVARMWREDWATDSGRAMLDFDQANAHNAVDRCAFLQRAHEVIPGLARWLRWIYPLDRATHIFYRGTTIDSWTGGQQGCPLIAACHALVQRAGLESLGIAQLDPGTSQLLPRIDPPVALDLAALYADDGILAGPQSEVLRAIQHLQAVLPRVGLLFSKLEVVAAAPNGGSLDRAAFEACGVTINPIGNTQIMKSPIGSPDFTEAYSRQRVAKIVDVYKSLSALPSRHAAFYLARYQGSRLTYLARTTPLSACGAALRMADAATQAFVQALMGHDIDDTLWQSASLPVRLGGLGLSLVAPTADAAYVASRSHTADHVAALYPRRPDGLASDRAWDAATQRLAVQLSDAAVTSLHPAAAPKAPAQKALSAKLFSAVADRCLAAANPLQRQHFTAQRAPGAGRWLLSPPLVDKPISDDHFAIALALRIGVDLPCARAPACRFCGACLDRKAIHDLSCTAGGDLLNRHNAVRDVLFAAARRGNLHPVLERAGLLNEPGLFLEMRRPADVLIEGALLGPGSSTLEHLAIDVKVINALGPAHADASCSDPLAAMQRYHDFSCAVNDTERRCLQQGISYRPAVFTAQGGVGTHADLIVTRLAAAIATHEGSELAPIHSQLLAQISLELVRRSAASVGRRRRTHPHTPSDAAHAAVWSAATRGLSAGLPDDADDDEPLHDS